MQYLISIYFDERTDKAFRSYIEKVARRSGNTYMTGHQVPAHITVIAFEAEDEEEVIAAVERCVAKLQCGTLQWVSVGALPNGVLYIAPVLNEYLHRMSEIFYNEINALEGVRMNRFYQPFQWLPHTTIAKKLTNQEMLEGFNVLQSEFVCREGKVVRIGLATKNPYKEIDEWSLCRGSAN